MIQYAYQVRFNTPAFLGDANHAGQWRTPPFKALLRQWWRVVHAPNVNFDVDALRRDEGRMFGVAADGGNSRKSMVQLRLSKWEMGEMDSWQRDDRLPHPEVTNAQGNVMNIGVQLYLGYGPLAFGDTGRRAQNGAPVRDTILNRNPLRTAIADDACQLLRVIVCCSDHEEIRRAAELSAWFGTLGSRSRNGWGSFQFEPHRNTPPIPPLTASTLAKVLRPLNECLQLDWPHAIGADEQGPLVWKTSPTENWREVMKDLARGKIAFRTQPGLSFENTAQGQFAKRHLLAYPVTHHKVNGAGWDNQGRLGNQLRFKVCNDGNHWYGVMVHLPCGLPTHMRDALPVNQRNALGETALKTWQLVHNVLDQHFDRVG